MTIGFLTGKFAPLHTGHIYFISKAATMVDTLYVILSYDGKVFKDKPELSLRNRLLWLKQTFKDLPHIKILHVDETDIPAYPDGWADWASLVNKSLWKAGKVNKVDKIFSSEPEYEEGFKRYWPEAQHVVIDAAREEFNISATKIRENPFKYWSFLPSVVRKHYVKKVMIMGTESCGKTTLTKYLAKYFQTSWVEEYGRIFCEQDMCMDETLLQSNDYATIAMRRYELEQEAILTANKLVIVDTSAVVTNYYHSLYNDGTTNATVRAFEELENYDLILFLDSDVPWVDDGLRINSDRSVTNEVFNNYLNYVAPSKYLNYTKISGTYEERLTKAIESIKGLFV